MSLKDYKEELLNYINYVDNWQQTFPAFAEDEVLKVDREKFSLISQDFLKRLENNYPFHHPLYAAQLLKSPHPVAMLGYIAAMMINPNNHALDGGPATAQMEKEAVDMIAKSFGFSEYLGHLTSSGTIANLEGLWIAREEHPDQTIIFSDQAHYTHERSCRLLKVNYSKVKSTPEGKMNITDLERLIKAGNVGTVVVTLGTTALGALDELDKILDLKENYDFRIHIDGAYGGFYAVISNYEKHLEIFKLISKCESFAIDPHKLGLQPYGCGCIIFNNPKVGKHYQHNSPYTYFTSNDLHLGEISLECSRAGASAAALWLTLQCFELEEKRGFGLILKKTRESAKLFADHIRNSNSFRLYNYPELDIVTYFPYAEDTDQITKLTNLAFDISLTSKDCNVYVAKVIIDSDKFSHKFPEIHVNTETVTIFRSCLLKPEHKDWSYKIVQLLEESVKRAKLLL